ncbi:MAG: hypothetical protein DRQ54_03190 [Gammaproteobacteria bacterium]|nr:MAG: hypothetical protein DRQ54_03190 [Gammaproteobacteria bacterium]RLA14428.1 MAG: hypothetical protein DRQ52_04285 [Gammaproteobacteria bacterium]
MAEMTETENAYNHPPMPEGPMNLWVGDVGVVPELLGQLAEGFRQMVPLGSPAPDFTGELLGGGEYTLSSSKGKKPVCILFASISDPPIISNLDTTPVSLNGLYAEYGDKVDFVMVYTREAHPGSGTPPHTSIEDKRGRAQQMVDQENVKMPVLVDALDGPIHQRYTMMPNSVYVINRGGIVAAKSLLLDSTVLGEMLNDVLTWDALDDGDTVVKKSYHERIHVCRAPYDEAGRAKECAALEASGPEMVEAIKAMAGFDPFTWKKA